MAFWKPKPKRDPLKERLEQVQTELAIATIERELEMMAYSPGAALETTGIALVSQGAAVAPSPFVDTTAREHRSILPWRRSHVSEAVPVPAPLTSRPVTRRGYVDGIPLGGTTPYNASTATTPGAPDRESAMTELLNAYLTCPWVSTCIDGIARTITAGGLRIEPVNTNPEEMQDPMEPPPEVARVQALLDYVNPSDDIRQLMRRVITDALIFGDAFVEVTWVGPEPVALWPLDCQTISIMSDEHGNVGRMIDGKLIGYVQRTENGETVNFEPHEVIHVKLDAPGASLYGVSPTSKASVPIKTWLFAAGLIKETMKRGDPSRIHVDWPITLTDPEIRKSSAQYAARNLGPRNIGNPFETKGGAKVVELAPNKIEYWLAVRDGSRDDILSTFGVPKRKAGVAVPGSLGGAGAESGEDKTYRVTTCGPTSEIVLEKFTFALCYLAYGIKDWRISFNEIDWRDDLTIEQIRDLRLRNGSWTRDRYAKDINEPPVEGGDQAVLVDRQNLVLWKDIAALSAKNAAPAPEPAALPPGGNPPPGKGQQGNNDPDETERQPNEPLAEYFARQSWRRKYERQRNLAA